MLTRCTVPELALAAGAARPAPPFAVSPAEAAALPIEERRALLDRFDEQ